MFKSGIFTYFCKFLILFSHGMLRNLIALTLSIITLSLNAAAPEGYYSSLDGLRDQSLKDRLHEIIRSHTRLSYNSLWDYYPETDVYPERKNGRSLVWDMYSDNWNNEKYYYPNGTRGLNREHSVPNHPTAMPTWQSQTTRSERSTRRKSHSAMEQARWAFPFRGKVAAHRGYSSPTMSTKATLPAFTSTW